MYKAEINESQNHAVKQWNSKSGNAECRLFDIITIQLDKNISIGVSWFAPIDIDGGKFAIR